tara:strand:- start:4 stop:540 length:537 start_codon:yes stop_codon:yes gene_type:complete
MKFKIFRFKKIKSTNNTAIRIIKNSNVKFGMIVAQTQYGGRGQYGRKWISYKENLLVSFFYSLKDLKLSMNQLTKINCLIVKKLISKYYKKKILYKKPNDLLVNQKKVCGILQETIEKLNEKYLIVGIGINLNKSPNIKNYPTTNLGKLLNKKISKKKIEIKLKNIFQIELSKLYRFN